MDEYTIKSAHLANPKKDQNWSRADQLNENKISKKLPHTKTIKCSMFAFLRLNKSTQKIKNITDAMIMMNWSKLKCICYMRI